MNSEMCSSVKIMVSISTLNVPFADRTSFIGDLETIALLTYANLYTVDTCFLSKTNISHLLISPLSSSRRCTLSFQNTNFCLKTQIIINN